MLSVKQTFTVLDRYKVKYPIVQVELDPGLPEWVDSLITQCEAQDIRYALDRYADPLVRKIRYTPRQALDRIPDEYRKCTQYKGCLMWNEKDCMNLKKQTCMMFEAGGATPEIRMALTDLVNLWRDGHNVVVVV